VLAAAGSPTPGSRACLANLCNIYWRPIYAVIRRHGYRSDEAQDLTQGFFATMLEKNYLGEADRGRGRFRTFLLAAVKHFLANEWDRAHALKRGGHQYALPIDMSEVEAWYMPEAVEQHTPETVFERCWAISLLQHVMAKLKAECLAVSEHERFDKISLLLNRDPAAKSYEAVAAELGTTPGALRVKVHRMRRRYRDLLRAEIAETVSTAADIDDEIRFLLAALRA
jgi:DNA-directed RNA polymerase specialized sigma24 family protein